MASPQPVWTARTGTDPADEMQAYGQCVDVDQALVEADLAGSIAHVAGLHAAGLLDAGEAIQLVEGLQQLAHAHAEGELELDPALEDVHMNVEHALEDEIGPLADKLHTARSRNDQVALDLAIVTRAGVVEIGLAAADLSATLADAAGEHASTPWPLHTHGLPGQPATLGYLLHAHAVRFAADAEHALTALDELDESPLGSGAGAGSTLPIDPAVPADLLGLSPPTNGLLATGARDGSLAVTRLAARVGHHVEALAVDLLGLAQAGAVELPDAYTTGSSIMPHKANPDALELARADGKKLAGLHDTLESIVGGLGLGYQRDLQRAKPPLLEALDTAPEVLGVLASVVDGLAADEETLAGMQDAPGVATTDAVEALVAEGVPFRQAHQVLAAACQAAEDGDGSIETALQASLEASDLAPEATEAALAALGPGPDPGKRSTTGGPAPETVLAALADLDARLADVHASLADAADAAAQPFELLDAQPKQLVAQAGEVGA